MNKDLTVGKPQTVLWKFCIPLFGNGLFRCRFQAVWSQKL